VLFEAARPILLNGIEDVISRPDLGDRAIFLTLTPIAEVNRRPEAELWREFEIARPLILGALLDAVVHGLQAINHVQLKSLPRMADFALWAAACETALWPAGTFARAYVAHRRAAIESIIEADPLANCVRTIMGERTSWAGSASDVASVCRECSRGHLPELIMGKKSAGTRRPAAPCPDFPSHAGHRDCVRARRAIGSAND
jgi:hypothetical protein